MTTLTALDATAHKNLRVDMAKVEEIGADMHMVPVVMSEFLKLIVHYPILFTKNSDTGAFTCVSLMGLQEGENLFWQQAAFKAIYVPLNITRHPFFVGDDDTGNDQYVICLNNDSDSLSNTRGEPLFNQDGSATPVLDEAKQKLAELLVGEQETQVFIDSLLELELLVPLSLDITFESGESRTLKGLYSIDDEKLNGLEADKLQLLQSRKHLQPAFTQIASLGHIYSLIEMKNKRNSTGNPWTTQ